MISKSGKILCFATLTVLTFLTLAAQEQQEADMRPVVCLDAKNFVDKTQSRRRPNFSALIDRVTHEFVQTGLYRVLNMEDAGKVLEKNDVFKVISDEGGKNISIPVPGYIVNFTVVQYGVNQVKAVDPVMGSKEEMDSATVEVILSIVDARTGQAVKSKNLPPITSSVPRRTAMNARQTGNYQEQALQTACREVARLTVQELIFNTEFYLLSVSGDNIEVDIPSSVAKPGQLFTVYKYGAARVSRRTGKRSFSKIPIGRIVLTKCDEESAMARPEGPFTAPVTTDCIVMWTKQEELPPAPPAPQHYQRGGGARPF